MLKKFGFTMIELLVVIAVIGILAVALLSSLNPLEQIRKGRDTRTRADMSQLIGGIERYNASLGYFPWQASEGQDLVSGGADINFVLLNAATVLPGCTIAGGASCTIDQALDTLTSTSEVKSSFVDRVTGATYADTYLFYNDETTGGSAVACFTPESQSFQKEAFDRCKLGTTAWSSEFLTKVYGSGNLVCPDAAANVYATATFLATDADEMICLP
jgi:prepilin-type N-terminal cleavage/methylation domain-containing protein